MNSSFVESLKAGPPSQSPQSGSLVYSSRTISNNKGNKQGYCAHYRGYRVYREAKHHAVEFVLSHPKLVACSFRLVISFFINLVIVVVVVGSGGGG